VVGPVSSKFKQLRDLSGSHWQPLDIISRTVNPLVGGELNAAYHVSSDDGKERHGIGRDLRTELLLEHLQKVPFREIHLENGMQCARWPGKLFLLTQIDFNFEHGSNRRPVALLIVAPRQGRPVQAPVRRLNQGCRRPYTIGSRTGTE
jgi:hypothetical protein